MALDSRLSSAAKDLLFGGALDAGLGGRGALNDGNREYDGNRKYSKKRE